MILITRCCQHVVAIVSVTSNSKTLLCLTSSFLHIHLITFLLMQHWHIFVIKVIRKSTVYLNTKFIRSLYTQTSTLRPSQSACAVGQ